MRASPANGTKRTRESRNLLDEGGKQEVKIIASGDLDEYRISGER